MNIFDVSQAVADLEIGGARGVTSSITDMVRQAALPHEDNRRMQMLGRVISAAREGGAPVEDDWQYKDDLEAAETHARAIRSILRILAVHGAPAQQVHEVRAADTRTVHANGRPSECVAACLLRFR